MNDKIKFDYGLLLGGIGIGAVSDDEGNTLNGTTLTCKQAGKLELGVTGRALLNTKLGALSPLALPWTSELKVPDTAVSPLEDECKKLPLSGVSSSKKPDSQSR